MRSRPTRVDLRELKERHDGMTMSAVLSSVVVPIVMAVLAALLFAIAAVTQNRAVTAVVDASGTQSFDYGHRRSGHSRTTTVRIRGRGRER